MTRFFKCEHCGNIIGIINNSGAPISCCGEKMKELVANTSDGAKEKHVPVVKVEGNIVTVEIGSVAHPMLPEHYIMWVYLDTKSGGQRKSLEPGSEPKVTFALTDDDKVDAVYAYCNLHGLWKAEV